jgi:hypothetical protein
VATLAKKLGKYTLVLLTERQYAVAVIRTSYSPEEYSTSFQVY